jgi:hypothetical protein
MRARRRAVTLFRRRRELDLRLGQLSQEERIAGILIVVLLATLCAAACATYVLLNRDKVRAPAEASNGTISSASRR